MTASPGQGTPPPGADDDEDVEPRCGASHPEYGFTCPYLPNGHGRWHWDPAGGYWDAAGQYIDGAEDVVEQPGGGADTGGEDEVDEKPRDWPTPDCQLGASGDPSNVQWVAKVLDARRMLGRFLDDSPLASQVGQDVRSAIVTLSSDTHVRYSRKYPTPPDYERGYIDGTAKAISKARAREPHAVLTRLARALGVSLDPDDPDPVGRLVEAAGKARGVEVVSGPAGSARTVTVTLPSGDHDVDAVDDRGEDSIVPGWSMEVVFTGSGVAAWNDGISVDGDLDEGARVDAYERDALRLLAAVYAHRQLAAAPAALAVGDEVTTAEQLETLSVGTALRDKQGDVVKVGTATGQGRQLWAAGDSETLHWRAVLPARVIDLPAVRVGTGGGESGE